MSLHDVAHYVGHSLVKAASDAVPVYHLAGRLYLSSSGWLLLKVPNALGKGAFDALDEPGIELPTRDTDDPGAVFNAHISVMSAEEVESLGGGDKITERGHMFRYTLGPLKTVSPKTWNNVSKVWYITVYSPELRALRKSYGLSPQPKGDWDFHITVGIRKTGVLRHNEKSKAAAADILPGGLADGKPDSDFDQEQLAKGRKVEKEHTSVPALPNEIAKDHLTEDPKYYDKLEKMESKKAREFVPGEDCRGCGASMEKDENGYCNSCGCEYDTGKDKGNYGKEAELSEEYLLRLLKQAESPVSAAYLLKLLTKQAAPSQLIHPAPPSSLPAATGANAGFPLKANVPKLNALPGPTQLAEPSNGTDLHRGANEWLNRNYRGGAKRLSNNAIDAHVQATPGAVARYPQAMRSLAADRVGRTRSPYTLQTGSVPGQLGHVARGASGVAMNMAPAAEHSGKGWSKLPGSEYSTYIHELEHVNQLPPKQTLQNWYDAAAKNRYAPSQHVSQERLSQAAEVPATLSELTHQAQGARDATGRPVQGLAPLTPGYQPSLEWLRQQAQQHGHIRGDKTMSELLQTPAGQSWLRMQYEELALKPHQRPAPAAQEVDPFAGVPRSALPVKSGSSNNVDIWHPAKNQFSSVQVPLLHQQVAKHKSRRIPLKRLWQSPQILDESRVQAADTSYPLIVDDYHEGNTSAGVVDGHHRLEKLRRSGASTAKTVRLTLQDIETLLQRMQKPRAMRAATGSR